MKNTLASLVFLSAAALATGPVWANSADIGPVSDRSDAARYLEAVFAESACQITEANLLEQMRADGQSPTSADMSMPSTGTDKMIRHRWIFVTLQEKFANGDVCADSEDLTLAISKFGGCA